jgi:hypothetical protein
VVQTLLAMLSAADPGTFEPLEELAVLLAAVIHDCAHPGVSNLALSSSGAGHTMERVYGNR